MNSDSWFEICIFVTIFNFDLSFVKTELNNWQLELQSSPVGIYDVIISKYVYDKTTKHGSLSQKKDLGTHFLSFCPGNLIQRGGWTILLSNLL